MRKNETVDYLVYVERVENESRELAAVAQREELSVDGFKSLESEAGFKKNFLMGKYNTVLDTR